MTRPHIRHIRIRLVRQAVFDPPFDMEGWQNYRIEYTSANAGPDPQASVEGSIWLPAAVNPERIEYLLSQWSTAVSTGSTGSPTRKAPHV